MELTPDEKKRIYEEEKLRLEAQEKARQELAEEKIRQKWEQEKAEKELKRRQMKKMLPWVIIAFLPCVYAVSYSVIDSIKETERRKPAPTTAPVTTIDLKGSVEFTGNQFIITNKDNFDWTKVKLEINSGILKGGYVLNTQRMSAGQTYTVGAMQFAKGDGTRLNPFTTKPQNFSIWCDTPKGKGHWYGGWD